MREDVLLCGDDDPAADGVSIVRVADALQEVIEKNRTLARRVVDEMLDEGGVTDPARRAALHAKAAAQLAVVYEPALHAQADRVRLQIEGKAASH